MKTKLLALVLLVLTLASALGAKLVDPHQWLESLTDPQSADYEKARSWVLERNDRSLKELQSDPLYDQLYAKAYAIATSDDRIPYPALTRGNKVYNFWIDEDHPRGVMRTTSLQEYKQSDTQWQTVFEFATLAGDNKDWVYRGLNCLEPQGEPCMMWLSNKGSDAAETREFDIDTGQFVEGGFTVPAGKNSVNWIDQDTLLIATNWENGVTTDAGFPSSLRLWKRGTPLQGATEIYAGIDTDNRVVGKVSHTPEGTFAFVWRGLGDDVTEMRYIRKNGTLNLLTLPPRKNYYGVFRGQLIFKPNEDWVNDGTTYEAGCVLGLDLETNTIQQIYKPPSDRVAVQSVDIIKQGLVIKLLDTVKGKLLIATPTRISGNSEWKFRDVPMPGAGKVNVLNSSPFERDFWITFESYTMPTTLYIVSPRGRLNAVKHLPALYDASDVIVEQRWTISKDGTRVPYFLVGKRSVLDAGPAPTLLQGYGGFGVSVQPGYSAYSGNLWINMGGIAVYSNIRGGGEFGPEWHNAAIKLHRQRAFDDFYAITEALMSDGVTTPQQLGIIGGSNGGLLVAVAFTQRPELYGAVVCQAALLDMLRFHLFPPGKMWKSEYGDPDDPGDRAVLESYSPYHNLRPDMPYPTPLFVTSLSDDRVGLFHEAKMVARMEELGYPYYLLAPDDGGHGVSTQPQKRAQSVALMYTYLWSQLGGEAAKQ